MYATDAMNAGPRKGHSARGPRLSPDSDFAAALKTRASPGRTLSGRTERWEWSRSGTKFSLA